MKTTLKQMTMFSPPPGWNPCPKGRRVARTTDGRGRHENSLAAHDVGCAVRFGRRAEIVAWLNDHGPATDREIATGMFGDRADMNMVRPRLTELLDAGAVVEVDRVRDGVTGMTVRRVAVAGVDAFESGNQESRKGPQA